jgi:hypothetical protein
LGLEILEARWLLAGDVSVGVHNGDLVIRGDNDDNAVVVGQRDGTYFVAGIDTNIRNEDFTVDFLGTDVEVKELSGVRDDVRATLRGGNDTLALLMSRVPGQVHINSGVGADMVVLGGVDAGHHVHINTTYGDDIVAIGGTDVRYDVNVVSGWGRSQGDGDPQHIL